MGLAGSALGGGRSDGIPRTPKQVALVELGRRLFFDPAVSRSGLSSCGSCHDPMHGFSDPARFSADDFGRTARHSQTIIDAADNPTAHWDGEFESVEELVVARLGVPPGKTRNPYGQPPPSLTPVPSDDSSDDVEEAASHAFRSHGVPVPDKFQVVFLKEVASTLEEGDRYADAFAATFGSPSVTTARLAEAIAAYVRSVRSTEAPLDRWLAGDRGALSPQAERGLSLFRGRAGCAQCHTLEGARPALTDYDFHNTGIAWQKPDTGRARIDTARGHTRAFKTPTLRDVSTRGPYMHDASFATLEEVVRHYAGGGTKDPSLDARIRSFEVSDEDVADLVAFLRTFTGEIRPGLASTLWRPRAERTRLRFVDGLRRPLASLDVAIAPSGDTLPGDLPRTSPTIHLTTDAKGWIEYQPPLRTHARIDLPEGLLPKGGTLVPDTCREAVIEVPVSGRVDLLITFGPGQAAPDLVVGTHETEMALPAPMVPRTTFCKESEVTVGDRVAARYVGWVRTDQSDWVHLKLPGDRSEAALRRVRLEAGRTIRHHVRTGYIVAGR